MLFVFVAAKHSKIFPGVASESDLQKWRASKDRKSPSLSQMGPDSMKHKVSQVKINTFAQRSSTCAAFILFVSGDRYFNMNEKKDDRCRTTNVVEIVCSDNFSLGETRLIISRYSIINTVLTRGLRHVLQFSLQDNGSAKYFQGAMHTPNMGEKVAQVSGIFLCRN